MPLLKMLTLRCLWVAFAAMLATAGVASAQTTITIMTEGAGFNVNGTPTFFVGKTTAQGFEGLRGLLK
jgi:protein-disulfide isomerase